MSISGIANSETNGTAKSPSNGKAPSKARGTAGEVNGAKGEGGNSASFHVQTLPVKDKNSKLGAHCKGKGVEFAVYSQNASQIYLCVFTNAPAPAKASAATASPAAHQADTNTYKETRFALTKCPDNIWRGYLQGAGPGTLYGYRADGAFDPEKGHFFNVNKLLLDPYACQIKGSFIWNDALYPYNRDIALHGKSVPASGASDSDSKDFVPFAVVTDNHYDWQGDKLLNTPWANTVIYEMNVKGFSKLNPNVPETERGTYKGLASPASVKHLKDLGITAVELLPVYLTFSEGSVSSHGLSNYWGYNPASLFIPDPRFAATDDPVNEFRDMVKTLHANGIEVILDVVYNHTAEQGLTGPALSWRGLDNANYYKLNKFGNFIDYTGCGNSIDMRSEAALNMAIDSLRYWVEDMHVDGFRFDLATTPARESENNVFNKDAAFFRLIENDPHLKDVKLIAEPWDCAAGGYQISNFPNSWSEWNGEWRDTMRRFWRGDRDQLKSLGDKLLGAPSLYAKRSPRASINFVTCHDGFTMRDIVSYNVKHNLANKEDNRDGSNDNYSWNCGIEGETPDQSINATRDKQVRNMIMTIAFSQGTPMLLGGDEMGRTQEGNNNAYCQDNEISYFNWNLTESDKELLQFTKKALDIRREYALLRQDTFDSTAKWYSSESAGPVSQEKLGEIGHNCIGLYRKDNKQKLFFALNSENEPLSIVLPDGKTSQNARILLSSDNCQLEDNKVILPGRTACLIVIL